MGKGVRDLEIRLDVHGDEELDELERAILKARASELSEVRRRTIRLTAGYGDATTRQSMDDEGRRAQIRYELLSRLLDAVHRATER